MLCLQCESKPEWVIAAANNLESILIDHAHCERKAAGNGISMIVRYPGRAELVKEMIVLINEEMEHFAFIFLELQKRNIVMTKDLGNRYAQLLSQNIRKQEPEKLLDLLLVDALIEARSCERFSLLSSCSDVPEELRKLYRELLASEAGHYRTFTDIARLYFSSDIVKQRLNELAEIEAEIVLKLPNEPTIHG